MKQTIVVAETVRPPAHPFYGDSYERGVDPFHIDAAPTELANSPAWRRGPRRSGWYLLDAFDNVIGFVPDGSTYYMEVPA